METIAELFDQLPDGYSICIMKLSDEQSEPEKGYMQGDAYVSIINAENTNEIGLDCKPGEVTATVEMLIGSARKLEFGRAEKQAEEIGGVE